MPLALASRAAPLCGPAADNAPATLRHARPPPPSHPATRHPARRRLAGAPLLSGAAAAGAPPRPRPGSAPPFRSDGTAVLPGADWLGSISGDRGGRGPGILLQAAASRAGPRAPWLRAPRDQLSAT